MPTILRLVRHPSRCRPVDYETIAVERRCAVDFVREAHGATGVDGHAEIRKTVDDALAKLKDAIRQIDARNYLDARNSLTSLAYEANSPAAS